MAGHMSQHNLHTTLWWQHAWRTLWRDARAGELRLLLIAVALGVAALSSVSFLADRLNAGLQRDASHLLGGDAVIVSDQVTPAQFVAKAKQLNLHGVMTLSFPTMARGVVQQKQSASQESKQEAKEESTSRLIALKVVDAGYPLRGQLKVMNDLQAAQLAIAQNTLDQSAQKIKNIPAPQTVWAEAATLEALGLQVGDAVMLGNQRFSIQQVLVHEPDRGAGFMNFAPRIMMNAADLSATGLVQPASRITWRYAVVGDAKQVQDFIAWAELESKKPEVRGVRVESLEAGRPEMRQTLDRAGKFLNLVALLAALLSAVAVALSARASAARASGLVVLVLWRLKRRGQRKREEAAADDAAAVDAVAAR